MSPNQPMLPRALLYRRKQGFAKSLAGLFRPGTLQRLLDEHTAARFDHSLVLWHLLVFEGFLASEVAVAELGPGLAVPA